jgi:2-methylcitrate dehydratase PrpD
VVRAVALGHEMSHRIHRVQDRFELDGGPKSDPLDVGHSMGSAVAASVCLGLDPDRIEAALSLAATMVADTVPPIDREHEHMVKSFMRGGVGSRNGVAAAFMAQAGFDAPPDIFDGPRGFFNARLGIDEPGPEFAGALGQEYSIGRTRFKRASAGGPNQGPRLALTELMAEHGLTHQDIAEIQVVIGPGGLNTVTSVPHPTVYYGYVLANAAVYGGIGFLQAHDAAYHHSPEVSSLRERIHIRADETWPTRGDERYRGNVTVTTNDGRQLNRESLWRRMSEEEVDAKFIYLAGLRIGEDKARELGGVLKQLDSVDNISDVLTQLEIPAAHLEDL